MSVNKNKIYGNNILGAFAFFNQCRRTEPFFLDVTAALNEFVYEKYKEKEDLFADFFKPEWDRGYSYFPNFCTNVFHNSTLIIGKNIRRIISPESLIKRWEELSGESRKFSLEIGIEFDRNFGCDETGNKNYRTRMERVDLIDLPYQGSVKSIAEELFEVNP